MSFIFQDFDLLFLCLFFILMCAIGGLIILSMLLQPKLEALLVPILVWGRDSRLQNLVTTNLAAHHERSRKTVTS